MELESYLEHESLVMPGVRYRVTRISLGKRIELTKRVRELSMRYEFHKAGDSVADKIEAALLSQEVDRLYLEWGLVSVEGLTIDREQATPETLVSKGPEALCREIVEAIRAECHLSEEERKN